MHPLNCFQVVSHLGKLAIRHSFSLRQHATLHVVSTLHLLTKMQKIAGIDGFEPSTNRLTVYCATAAPYPHNIYILLINSFNSFADVGKLHALNHLRIALSDTLYLFPIFTKDFNSK